MTAPNKKPRMSSPSPTPSTSTSSLDTRLTMTGYLFDVSPMKVSRNNARYFNAKVQVAPEEYHAIVCYTPEKRSDMSQAASNSTPVKVSRVSRILSYSDPSGYDVKFDRSSTFEVADVLPFPPKEPCSQEPRSLSNIKGSWSLNQDVTIHAKVTSMEEAIVPVNVRGTDIDLKKCVVSDVTGSISLSLWANHTKAIQCEKTYVFSHLTTREFNGIKSLSTTKQSTFKRVEDMQNITQDEIAQPKLEEFDGCVSTVNLVTNQNCQSCHKTVKGFEEGRPTVKCPHCQSRQRTADLQKSLTATMTIDGVQGKVTAFTGPLSTYLTAANLISESAEDIEEHFLICGPLHFTLNVDNVVISINAINSD